MRLREAVWKVMMTMVYCCLSKTTPLLSHSSVWKVMTMMVYCYCCLSKSNRTPLLSRSSVWKDPHVSRHLLGEGPSGARTEGAAEHTERALAEVLSDLDALRAPWLGPRSQHAVVQRLVLAPLPRRGR
jgi:hypothetical protein